MTEQEKNEILDELEKRMEKKIGCVERPKRDLLRIVRKKWFDDGKDSPMGKAFSEYPENIWECIRRLTVKICNKKRVIYLEESDNADEIAERICQFIYDLKVEVKEDSKK